MEFVNINSLRSQAPNLEGQQYGVLGQLGTPPPEGTVVATDTLELLHGHELVEKARVKGERILPLRRLSPVRETDNFPKRVLLELTTHCNSMCTMCPRNVLIRRMQHMDTQLAKEVISQLGEVGLSGLWLYNIGESLLHPDFFEILDFCRQFNSLGTIWLSTNGESLEPDLQEKILASPIDILNYSINSMSAEGFAKIAPPLHFERVRGNLQHLLLRKHERTGKSPLIRVQMIKLPHVLGELEAFKEEYGDKADILSINEWEVFSQNIPPADTGRGTELKVNSAISRCNRLDRGDFFIFSDGSVSCCDTDFNCILNLGNVHEQTVKEIYDGMRYQDLLEKHRNGRLHEVELCSKCLDFTL